MEILTCFPDPQALNLNGYKHTRWPHEIQAFIYLDSQMYIVERRDILRSRLRARWVEVVKKTRSEIAILDTIPLADSAPSYLNLKVDKSRVVYKINCKERLCTLLYRSNKT